MGWKIRGRGENLYHHVYAWGNDRHPVFKETNHYCHYLHLLSSHAHTHDIGIIAYALMEWHVHLFIYDPNNEISEFMMDLHGDYAAYFNRVTTRVGHVFGERYNNKIVMCNIYGRWLSRYIHRQAVEAGLVKHPEDYPWTSYRVYIGKEKNRLIDKNIILDQFGDSKDKIMRYKEFVDGNDDGPVNWDSRHLHYKSLTDLIKLACDELHIDPVAALNPKGRAERLMREKVLLRLIKKYKVRAAYAAKTFNLSHSAVTLMLRRADR
jgi:REP element-mobilizing transposase RayT